jgi:hypothetical protein
MDGWPGCRRNRLFLDKKPDFPFGKQVFLCEEEIMLKSISFQLSGKMDCLKSQAKNSTILILFILMLLLFGCGASGSDLSASTMYANKSATLAWDAPTINEDGTPLTDLSGYKVYYGTSSGNYTQTIDVGNYVSIVIDSLTGGTWFFAVKSYDSSGNESAFSNEVSKNIT